MRALNDGAHVVIHAKKLMVDFMARNVYRVTT
jgi:hypothetical protein